MAEQGVLLYYRFVDLPQPEATAEWFETLCTSLDLRGRVRISPTGINVTVGGSMESLNLHVKAVEEQELFRGCDFKLAPCTRPVNSDLAAASGFDSLSVRLVEEIVTLGVYPSPSLRNAAKHVSPREFHTMLDEASAKQDTVVLDARNIYETRIGTFQPPAGVDFFDPRIRQYSDLPSWIDEHADQLRNKSILMYCTGGVRCEMASSYIRSKGGGFENVFQLSGGIQRYLEAFPDGGYFQGKNFVFDHRLSVPSEKAEILGSCLICGSSYDDYSSRSRCSLCRMLVLVCPNCKAAEPYVCELCKVSRDDGVPKVSGSKLRILCLHGFRQNASNMKGRLGSFMKKLKHTAEFVFVDAPHGLPFIYQLQNHKKPGADTGLAQAPKQKFAWLVDPSSPTAGEGIIPAEEAFDPMQYIHQTSGWNESWNHLQKVFRDSGPFDGVLGFSQGAAVAAILAALKQAGLINFKFVVLSSGFVSSVLEEQLEQMGMGELECPSLHIFCAEGGNDRQIGCEESEKLATRFSSGRCRRMIVRHSSGHMIPTGPEYMEQYLAFLTEER